MRAGNTAFMIYQLTFKCLPQPNHPVWAYIDEFRIPAQEQEILLKIENKMYPLYIAQALNEQFGLENWKLEKVEK